ncbi:MAG: glycoside hydrolase family 3 N-terminal domain-containing protein [Chloroflexia bacterium]
MTPSPPSRTTSPASARSNSSPSRPRSPTASPRSCRRTSSSPTRSRPPGHPLPRILTDLLRGELGFDGLIVSDAMDMSAILEGWGVVEGCVRYIAAGGDFVEPLREERAVHAAIVAAPCAAGASPPPASPTPPAASSA